MFSRIDDGVDTLMKVFWTRPRVARRVAARA